MIYADAPRNYITAACARADFPTQATKLVIFGKGLRGFNIASCGSMVIFRMYPPGTQFMPEAARNAFELRCISLYARQYSTYAIAEKLGCSQGRVRKALVKWDVPMRSQSEAITISHRDRGHQMRDLR